MGCAVPSVCYVAFEFACCMLMGNAMTMASVFPRHADPSLTKRESQHARKKETVLSYVVLSSHVSHSRNHVLDNVGTTTLSTI